MKTLFLTILFFLSSLTLFGQGYSKATNGWIVSSKGDTTSIQSKWKSKNIVITEPLAGDDLFGNHWEWKRDFTIKRIHAVLVGTSVPSVTWTIRHGTDRNAAGAEVTGGGYVTTSTTTGTTYTAFNDATINSEEMLWFEITDQSGTVTELNITVYYYMGDIE